MRLLMTLTFLAALRMVGSAAAADVPPPTPPPTPAPASGLVTKQAATTSVRRPDLVAEGRAIGAQLGVVELATWRLAAPGGDVAAVVAAVKEHLAAERPALKRAIAASAAVRCEVDASGAKLSLRVLSKAATAAYHEAYAAASADVAAIKEKLAADAATRAVASRVTEEESAFRSDLCREILAEQAAQRTPLPIIRRGQGPVADS